MKILKVVIFDMDGLMFDTERISYLQYQRAADELNMDYNVEIYKGNIGMNGQQYIDYIHDVYKDHPLVEEFLRLSKEYRQKSLANPNSIEMKEGLIELLDYLERRKIARYIASSSKVTTIQTYIESKDLSHYFDGYIGGDQVKVTKPNPEIYLKAIDLTGVIDKNEILVLEDSKNGLIAAKDAGLSVIIVPDMIEPSKYMQEQATVILDSLLDVIEYIDINY